MPAADAANKFPLQNQKISPHPPLPAI